MADTNLKGRHVLIVEDEYMLATDLERELEDAGAIVIGPVPSVEAAQALIAQTSRIDGAVLDVNLAGSMIFPVVDTLRERGVPVILTTGYDQSAIPAAYMHLPRCEKPLIARQVAMTLQEVLASVGA